ncbi:MAG TPA: hypothetical protein VM871_10135 [Flavisolibacter sp.]|nr:hypothetical protein [Flavisolibacter sp.]
MINFFYRRCVFPAVLLFLLMNCACGQNKISDDVSGSIKKKLGIRSGFNLLSLPRLKTADQTLNSNTGFFAGGYYSLPAKRIGYRSELIFSRQGYDYKTRTQTGNVKLD